MNSPADNGRAVRFTDRREAHEYAWLGQTLRMPAALPIAPAQNFASDNTATVHPAVMQALVDANVGHQIAYGDDTHTAECEAHLRDLLGAPVESLLVWGGTGANVVGLATMLHASEAVI
jgi:Beta-eliminating lyase